MFVQKEREDFFQGRKKRQKKSGPFLKNSSRKEDKFKQKKWVIVFFALSPGDEEIFIPDFILSRSPRKKAKFFPDIFHPRFFSNVLFEKQAKI